METMNAVRIDARRSSRPAGIEKDDPFAPVRLTCDRRKGVCFMETICPISSAGGNRYGSNHQKDCSYGFDALLGS